MEAIMDPSVTCQFNMCGRNRKSKKPTTTPTIKLAFHKMDNIIDCIVEAYRGRPFEKRENEDKFGGSEEKRALWIL
jgi:hypothetical protein